MDKEKITKIVSQVRSKVSKKKKSKQNTVDTKKENAKKIANILLDIEKCIRDLED